MDDDGGSATKREGSPAQHAAANNPTGKRMKNTPDAPNTPVSARRDFSARGNAASGDADTTPGNTSQGGKANLRGAKEKYYNTLRDNDDLRAKLKASEQRVEEYRYKLKYGADTLVKEQIIAAETRASEAEAECLRMAKEKKQEIAKIRNEVLKSAQDMLKSGNPRTAPLPEELYGIAETGLRNLQSYDPEQYFELVQTLPEYVKLEAQLKTSDDNFEKQHRKNQLEILKLKVEGKCEAQSPEGPILPAVEALEDLAIELYDASDEMRSNSTLANQKKTLTRKMMTSLARAAPAFTTLGQQAPDSEDPQEPGRPVDKRRIRQLEAMVKSLNAKLGDVRGKLGDEVKSRIKLEGESMEVD